MNDKKITKLEEKLTEDEKKTLVPMLATMIENGHSRKATVLIDDIEMHLDFNQQKKIISHLKEMNSSNQFIISTSSPYVVAGALDDKHINIIDVLDKDKIILNEAKRISEYIEKTTDSDIPLIITEGKTDWKHLKKALKRFNDRGEYLDIKIDEQVRFYEYDTPIKNPNQGKPILFENIETSKTDMGDNRLDKLHDLFIQMEYPKKTIFIFDRDNEDFVEKHGVNRFNKNGNIYSFCIPEVEDSDSPKKLDYICIEFYYQEEDLIKFYNGKRLFFADEFNQEENTNRAGKCDKYLSKNGEFKTEGSFFEKEKKGKRRVKETNVKKRPELTLHSFPVYNIDDECKEENSLLLSKNDFVDNLVDTLDIENFKLIFDVIEKIVND